jgi:hypothetical protein
MTQPSADEQGTISHQRVVRASARVLAFRRWNRDDKGISAFQQLVLWLTGDEKANESNSESSE